MPKLLNESNNTAIDIYYNDKLVFSEKGVIVRKPKSHLTSTATDSVRHKMTNL
jgi:hypothetical protein